jgi:predicted HD superfamily hydrolase involved in NAD metabolism
MRRYAREHLTSKRMQHTEGVRVTAIALARRYGADPQKAEQAALCHDLFRGRAQGELDRLVDAYDLPQRYRGSASLAHGKLAAAFLARDWGIEDRALLDAVSYHTTGRAGMSTLEKVVFLADAIEPGRAYPGVEKLRQLAQEDLDAGCLASLEGTIRELQKKGRDIDPDSLAAAADLRRRVREKGLLSSLNRGA